MVSIVVDAALKGCVILLAACTLNLALRRASASVRHLVWTLAMAGLLALPILSLILPQWQIAVLPQSTSDIPDEASLPSSSYAVSHIPVPEEKTYAPVLPPVDAAVRGTPQPSNAKRRLSVPWQIWMVSAWMAGFIIMLAPLLVGMVRMCWIVRKAKPVTDGAILSIADQLTGRTGLFRKIPILQSDKATMPMVCGVLRPLILLPSETDEWSDDRLRVVLLHELAHVRRRDCMTQFVAHLGRAVHWFNPLGWYGLHRLYIERERACDDIVLTTGSKASEYADHLLDIARSLRIPASMSAAAVTIASPRRIEARLTEILDATRNRCAVKRFAVILGAVLMACVVGPLAALRAVEIDLEELAMKIRSYEERLHTVSFDAHFTAANWDSEEEQWVDKKTFMDFSTVVTGVPGGKARLDARQLLEWSGGAYSYSAEEWALAYNGEYGTRADLKYGGWDGEGIWEESNWDNLTEGMFGSIVGDRPRLIDNYRENMGLDHTVFHCVPDAPLSHVLLYTSSRIISVDRVELDGEPCIRLDVNEGLTNRLFLSERRGYAVVRRQRLLGKISERRVGWDSVVKSLEEVAPGIWWPKEIETLWFGSNSRERYHITITNVRVNSPEISDDMFTIKFPLGFTVEDERTGTRSVIGRSGADLDPNNPQWIAEMKEQEGKTFEVPAVVGPAVAPSNASMKAALDEASVRAPTEKPEPSKEAQHSFAIFNVKTLVDVTNEQTMQEIDLEKLVLDPTPLLTDEDIVSYDWDRHLVRLKPGVRERMMPKKLELKGIPFVVVAGGERIYLGAFRTPVSSFAHCCPVIHTHPYDMIQEDDGSKIENAFIIHPPMMTPEGSTPSPHEDLRISEALEKKADYQGVLEGIVLGPDGEPLAHAPLSLTAFHHGLKCNALRAIADEQGRWRMENVPPGRHLLYYPWEGPTNVEVAQGIWDKYKKPGEVYPSAPIKGICGAMIINGDQDVAEGETISNIVMDLSQSTAAAEGRVTDADGRPVEGIEVFLRWKWARGAVDVHGEDFPPAVTDSEGHYRLEHLPPGKWTLRAWYQQSDSSSSDVPVELEKEQTTRQDLRMKGRMNAQERNAELTEDRIEELEAGGSRQARTPRAQLHRQTFGLLRILRIFPVDLLA